MGAEHARVSTNKQAIARQQPSSTWHRKTKRLLKAPSYMFFISWPHNEDQQDRTVSFYHESVVSQSPSSMDASMEA
jgi:hypothetical protein